MSLEFNEAMYVEMEGFVGKRQIFGRATNVVDSNRMAQPDVRQFGRAFPTPRERVVGGLGVPSGNATTTFESPTTATLGDDLPGSTGRKKKAVGEDNLVDFVKDFNFRYLSRVVAQEKDKHAWRGEIMALGTTRKAKIAKKMRML